ncbi:hypothetical protein M413DRAFT_367115 [Hebeloma cylindrosporum]|uniref:Uncharacterized protein n=1 Tax=Hebeloma cylindrosporum TaxID=76867 RepID=A0A0C2Y4Z1_HEBCY|nr:hypothetical protein M413DRAFT_367115 [Hebeloma cylindrosporum h7]
MSATRTASRRPIPPTIRTSRPAGINVNYKPPATVESIRTGWQHTCQASAIVSGLLAGVAAQLLSFFRSEDVYKRRPTSQGAKDTVLALCYATLLLNVAAMISAFMVIDKMGSLTMNGATIPPPQIGRFYGTHVGLLVKFGGSPNWRYMFWHWLICFYGGVVCLILLVLVFIWLQEPLSIGVVMTGLVGFAIIPSLVFLVMDS